MAGKPGRSGRKRHGTEPKVYFNSRMDTVLRKELQAAAKAGGRTLSAEIETRLKNSLVPAGKLDDATRALCLLIAEASKEASDGNRNWTNNLNFNFVFQGAVGYIIDIVSWSSAHKRRESADEPFEHPVFKSREDMARAVALRVMGDVMKHETEAYSRAFRVLGNPEDTIQYMRARWKAWDLLRERIRGNLDLTTDEIEQAAREIASEQGVVWQPLAERAGAFASRRRHREMGKLFEQMMEVRSGLADLIETAEATAKSGDPESRKAWMNRGRETVEQIATLMDQATTQMKATGDK